MLNVDSRLSTTQQTTTVHVLISTTDMTTCIVSASGGVEVSTMQIPRLPMPLKDTKALTVDEGLRRTPAVRPIELAYETFDAKATLPMSNTSNDDATANDKQFAIAVRDPGHRRTCTSRMRCNLHKIKHVETALTTMIGVSLIGQLFGHAKALRTGNYWFRLCTSVESFVDKYLEFDIACPIETGIEE